MADEHVGLPASNSVRQTIAAAVAEVLTLLQLPTFNRAAPLITRTSCICPGPVVAKTGGKTGKLLTILMCFVQ